jgi:hypothetical protein
MWRPDDAVPSEMAAVRGELPRGDSKTATKAAITGVAAAIVAGDLGGAPLGSHHAHVHALIRRSRRMYSSARNR